MRALKRIFGGVPMGFKAATCVIGFCFPAAVLADSTPPRLYPMATLPMDAFSQSADSNSPAGSGSEKSTDMPGEFDPVPQPTGETAAIEVPKSLLEQYA